MKSKRRLDDWLSSYLKYTENSESPISYHTWSGISCIAGALQRKVYMRWGLTTIFPNQYIVLVGPSGRARKSEPINIANDMLNSASITMLGEDNTPEAIILDISAAAETFLSDETGELNWQSAVSSCVEELAVFTGEQNTRFLAYLTNWYDTHSYENRPWRRKTKHQGTDELVKPCLNLLAATAPDWFPYIFTKAAVGGGFTSRVIFVVETKDAKIIADPNEIEIDLDLRHSLVHDLELIKMLTGEYKFSPETLEFYKEWYTEQREGEMNGVPILSDPIFGGYVSRRATHIKKIAIALAASLSDNLIIELSDIKRALSLMEITEGKMHNVFTGLGRSKYIEETELIISYIKQHGSVTTEQLLKALYRNISMESLEEVMKILTRMKVVKMKQGTDSTQMIYTWKGEKDD